MRRGLKTVKYICKEYDIRGVFGPIIELLDCDERFFTAVEVTAGNRYMQSLVVCLFVFISGLFFLGAACTVICSWAPNLASGVMSFCFIPCLIYLFLHICCLYSLFHVVVENDEISTKIIKHLNSLKGGRVTFIPLNRVRAPHVSYPQSSDVVPLLKKLKFSSNYTPAFAQVSICILIDFGYTWCMMLFLSTPTCMYTQVKWRL